VSGPGGSTSSGNTESSGARRALDAIDRRLLALLQADGRISNLDLARHVELSATSVLDRVRRLVREGYILGYEARLNPALLDAGQLVFVQLTLHSAAREALAALDAALQALPPVQEAHWLAGAGAHVLLKMRVADLQQGRDFARDTLWKLPGVRDVRLLPVLAELKQTATLPL
jgi:Lrp/AsnC family leucine-responsive transcriptional regulator